MHRGYTFTIYLGLIFWAIGTGTGKHIGIPESVPGNSISSVLSKSVADESDAGSLSSTVDDASGLYQNRRRVKKVLEAHEGQFDDGKGNGDVLELSHKLPLRRPKREALRLPVPNRLVLFPSLAISQALRLVNSTVYNVNKNRSAALEEEQRTSLELEKPMDQIETKANISANDLRQFHSTMLYGVMKACPSASKSYKDMLKVVDRSSNAKIKLIQARLPLASSNPNLTKLFGRIRKCYMTFAAVPNSASAKAVSSEDENESVSEKKRSSSTVDRIRAYLNEEGRKLRRTAQLDIVPTSENLIQFERLGFRLISDLCKMDDETEAEHHRIGTLMLSALDSAPNVPKATVHQTEMEELIAETRKCLKTFTQYAS